MTHPASTHQQHARSMYATVRAAILERDLHELTRLLDAGLNPNATAPTEPTLLERAMQVNFVDGALLLLERGAEVTEEEPSLLCQAVQRLGSTKLCEALIAAGADVNERGMNDAPALYFAVEQGDAAMCRLLLDAGAKVVPPKTETLGQNPMGAAATSRRTNASEIIRMLVAAGASTSAPYAGGTFNLELTPFQFAVAEGFAANVAMMMAEFGEDPGQVTATGKTMQELANSDAVRIALRVALSEQAMVAAIDEQVHEQPTEARALPRTPAL